MCVCVCIYIYIYRERERERERYVRSKFLSSLTLSQTLKGFADDHFKFDENGRKFSKLVEHSIGKREIAHEQFLLFQQCFQKTCSADT